MYNHREVLKLAAYYTEKVMDQLLDEKKGTHLKIHKLRIKDIHSGGYNLYCYATGSKSVEFYRDIESVAKDLELPSPKQVLKD